MDDTSAFDSDDESVGPTFTVTNPSGSVSVSTFVDGRVSRVELTDEVATMAESDLAEEIVVIARLATQQARAAQYRSVLDGMRERGHDDAATRDFLSRDLDLPSPEEADTVLAQVFTTRYADDHD